jgi:hypothetical protein
MYAQGSISSMYATTITARIVQMGIPLSDLVLWAGLLGRSMCLTLIG